jgi:hypothetical protein
MEVAVLFVKYERRKSLYLRRCLKYFCFQTAGNKEEFGIRAEGNCRNLIAEVEMRKYNLSLHVYDQTEAIFVY